METGETRRKNLIELRDASVASASSLGEIPVVEKIDWRIDEGEYWIIGGVPGCGKSDLMATAAGLQKPLAGEHFLFGRRLLDLEEHELLQSRLKLGLVFDRGARLFNNLTVAENLALPLAYHHNLLPEETKHQVTDVLEWTGLCDVAEKIPGDLPRSIKQRVGLARALMLDPEVLFLDNPLNGVDQRHFPWWLEFLNNLFTGRSPKKRRTSTLVVTADDLRPWANAGNRFAILRDKQWVHLGDREGFEASQDSLLKDLLSGEFALT